MCSERRRPLIFCWDFAGRASRSEVVRRGDGGVGEEPQDVGLAVLEAFQQ